MQNHASARKRALSAAVGATTAVVSLAFGGGIGHATSAGTVGKIAYVQGGNLVVANADGSSPVPIVSGGVSGAPSWYDGGARIAYIQNGNAFTAQYDGSHVRQYSTDGLVTGLSAGVYRPHIGDAYLDFADNGQLCNSYVDPDANGGGGKIYCGDAGSDPATGTAPADSDSYSPDFYVDANGFLNSNGNPSTIKALQPDVSPDDTKVAYIDPASGQVYVVSFTIDQNTGKVVYGSTVDATGDATPDSYPRWSPDGAHLTYTNSGNVIEIPSADKEGQAPMTTLVTNASGAAWQPVGTNRVVRAWGSDAIETAIATSQLKYKTVGNLTDPRAFAQGVVLSRSDAYYDALAGSAFAADKSAPLLMTHTASLDAPVLAEIKRVLPSGGTVYLLGGKAALSSTVESQVTAAGYKIVRFAGSDMYDTAVKVDKAISSSPGEALIATGSSYYDALAAGPIAAEGDRAGNGPMVIVLTKGGVNDASMPAESAAYLDSLTPSSIYTQGTYIVGVGGPGNNALQAAYKAGMMHYWPTSGIRFGKVVGSNAEDTAVKLATTFNHTGTLVGLATKSDWHDALAAGAELGSSGGVLLLTSPTGLNQENSDYLAQNSPDLAQVNLFGGTAALPASIVTQVSALIGPPGTVGYVSFTPGSGPLAPLGHLSLHAGATPALPGAKTRFGARGN
jgi:hypothetical protein